MVKQTVTEQLIDMADEVCRDYCKYYADAERENDAVMLESHCEHCPMMRI